MICEWGLVGVGLAWVFTRGIGVHCTVLGMGVSPVTVGSVGPCYWLV